MSRDSSNRPQHRPVYDEAALKDFVFATTDPDKEKSLLILDSILADAAHDSSVFYRTVDYLEKPFGKANSAYRNEDLYAEILQAKIKSEWIDSATKAKTREKLFVLMQNRPGSTANDFIYITPGGFKKKMYELKADFTILFFYNPECGACKDVKEAIFGSAVIKGKIKSKDLKVLAIYTDKSEKTWLDHLPEMPAEWLHGRDEDEFLYKNQVYELRVIPTVYLLDKDKKVVLKDCVDVKQIEKELH